jgi:hypothetical protein
MSIIDIILRPKSILQIMMRVLIIFVFFVSILPFDKPDVIAQEPDKQQIVFLPLVLKNSLTSCPEGPEEWLCLFNQYRTQTGLDPISHNLVYSEGLNAHTSYLINCPQQVDVNVHRETECENFATLQGDEAGRNSNMAYLLGGKGLTQKDSIDLWMATASHRYKMLNPYLPQSGFSLKCEFNNCFSGLNIQQSLNYSTSISTNNYFYPNDMQQNIPPTRFPITWGFYVPWINDPDFLLGLGPLDDSKEVFFVSASIYNENEQKVRYTISEPNHSDGVCEYNNQIVITPTENLLPNQKYRVEMVVSFRGQTFSKSWSFTTAP